MTNSLLLMAYPYQGKILTSFRYATGYGMPDIYTGNAQLTQISSSINSTHYTLVYRCQNCMQWNQGGATGSQSTSSAFLLLGWCQAYVSPTSPACPGTLSLVQHDAQNIFGAQLHSAAANPSYSAWAANATSTVTGTCGGTISTITSTGTSALTSTSGIISTNTYSGVPVPTETAYDYVIIGAGAGGIPLADKLSEAGKKILLIEKGPPSSGRWGGTTKPSWLSSTNLTRFDVPGLCNEIWANSSSIACTDTDQMAGCVLGGGTAINSGL
jgi:cellobiose dehydrogenase (acceptor)